MKRPLCCLLFCLFIHVTSQGSYAREPLGLKVPDGFRVSVYADESVANDTYAMTLDSHGRVVVTTRGVIKTLHENPKTGKADRFTVFARTETGGMGLCFDGNDLLFCGDGWLSRFSDMDGDGQADGQAKRIVPLAFSEHGGHAIRKGPDGFWYVIGGNDSGISSKHASKGSPITSPEAGGMLRLPPDLSRSEIIAQGFRNPYDFDFNAYGDLFTYDSDVERDIFLPWYTPTRIDHVAIGGHHGWRLTGYLRSWPRPDYDPGTVDILSLIGRGSPTGVVCYRHLQFPEHYRGGLFVLDWTFGKIYFVKPTPKGASYTASVEIFMEPEGTSGFAPTDAEVAPDGSLLISVGGRGTRGLVYKVEHIDKTHTQVTPEVTALARVLTAPRPLDAWSRKFWEPKADRLGKGAFSRALRDHARRLEERIRAIEILTERFAGLSPEQADELSRSENPELRARIAWSLGRVPIAGANLILERLSIDDDPRVRREALDAFGEAAPKVSILAANLGHADKRVRLSAIHCASQLPEASWQDLRRSIQSSSVQTRISGLLTEVERSSGVAVHEAVIDQTRVANRATTDPELRLQGVRLIQRALGDYRLKDPSIEVLTGYSTQSDLSPYRRVRRDILDDLRPLFPAGNEKLDDEVGRLLAMLEDDDQRVASVVPQFWTETSSATRDLHFLIIFSRLRAMRTANETAAVAQTLVGLDGKLSGQEQRTKQSWNLRIGELVPLLLKQDAALGAALLREPKFVNANHAALALALAPVEKTKAARAFLKAIDAVPDDAWSGPLIDLLAVLPPADCRPIFREQWVNRGLRDAILPKLAEAPEVADRARFLDALDSSQSDILKLALGALNELPEDLEPARLVPLIRLLRRLTFEPKEKELRSRTLALFSKGSKQPFQVDEIRNDTPTLRRVYEPIFSWFTSKYPELAKETLGGTEDAKVWSERIAKVDWNSGNVARGTILFQNRGCATCHTGSRALGPSLAGVTSRLSRNDLFTAIVAPSLDVAPPYRLSMVETRDGKLISGLIAFESADGLIIQTGATTTVRIGNAEIVSRHVSTRSLMPDQLLQGMADRDLADLDAYLRSIPPR